MVEEWQLWILEPIINWGKLKTPVKWDDYIAEVNHTEKIFSMILVSNRQPSEIMQQSKEAFYFPTVFIASQFAAILVFGLFSTLLMGCYHFDTSLTIHAGLASSTVIHIKNVVSGVLNKAVDDEIIPANPCHGLGKIVKAKDRKESIDPLSVDELNFLLEAVKKHYAEHYTLVLLLARTGMRIGEALALQWGDIDFNGRFIEVKRSIVRGKVSTPKSGKSRRVDMSLQLTDALKAHMLESKKKG